MALEPMPLTDAAHLAWLQARVGGYVERVACTPGYSLWVNEDSVGLDRNYTAMWFHHFSSLAGSIPIQLAGTVVVLGDAPDDDGTVVPTTVPPEALVVAAAVAGGYWV